MAYKKWYLILILFLALSLRLHDLTKESIWPDEANTALAIKNSDASTLVKNVYLRGNVLPGYYAHKADLPVYYLLLELWSIVFSASDFSLRLFSVIFGVLSVYLIYKVSRLICNEKISLICALILSISLINISYSQEARVYSFYCAIGLLSTYFYIKALSSNRQKYWALFVISSLIGLYSHYLYILFIGAQITFLVIRAVHEKFSSKIKIRLILKKFKKEIWSFIIIFIGFSIFIPRMLFSQVGLLYTRASIGTLVKTLAKFSSWIYPSFDLQLQLYAKEFGAIEVLSWITILSVVVLIIGMSLLAIYSIYKRIREFAVGKNEMSILPIVLFVVPILAEILITMVSPRGMIIEIRYILYTVPFFALLVADGAYHLDKKFSIKASIILLLVFSILPIYMYYVNPEKPNWKDAAEFVEQRANQNEIILTSYSGGAVAFDYYFERNNSIKGICSFNSSTKVFKTGKGSGGVCKELSEIKLNNEGIWLLLSYTKYSDPKSEIKNFFETNHKRTETKMFYDIEVYRYS